VKYPRIRRWIGLALLVVVVFGLGWALGRPAQGLMESWTGERDLWEQIKGTVALIRLEMITSPLELAPYTPMAHTGLSPYGVNTFLEQEVEPEKVERSLQLISQAGFAWIRQEFPWEDIEKYGKGDFWDHRWGCSTWEKYDRIVDLAEKYDLEIIARLDNPPAWSRAVGNAPGWSLAPPDDPEDFGDFVYAVVSRYRGRIRYYQIWNEPNIFPEWGDQPADPKAYVELLKIAYRRAKEADPDCVVIAAGLAQTTEDTPWEFGPRNVSDLIYLEEMYRAGVQGHFDVMGAMVYGLWTGPHDRRVSRDRTNFARVQLLREIMVRHGDADKPIWATEVGWNALPPDFPGLPIYGRVTLEQQATYAVAAYQRAELEWPWMGVMNYWFFRRPSDRERDQAWYYFRMLEPDFQPLPVYQALAELMHEPPTVYPGFYQEDHWALHYSPGWTVKSDPRALFGGLAVADAGQSLSFRFHGTRLGLVLGDVQQAANLRVWVDGKPQRSFVITQAPHTDREALVVARYLGDRPHQVELQIVDGQVALDGLIVWRNTFPLGRALILGLGALLIGIALVAYWRGR